MLFGANMRLLVFYLTLMMLSMTEYTSAEELPYQLHSQQLYSLTRSFPVSHNDRNVISAPSKELNTNDAPKPKINTLVQQEKSKVKQQPSTNPYYDNKSSIIDKHNASDRRATQHSTSRSPDKRVTDKPVHKEDRKDRTVTTGKPNLVWLWLGHLLQNCRLLFKVSILFLQATRDYNEFPS